MSIIAEALKKVEEQKEGTSVSKEYMHKILGPERKATYKREGLQEEAVSSTQNSRIWVSLAILILLAIIFLTVSNIFLVPSTDVKTKGRQEISGYEETHEAEAYTDMNAEIALIENKRASLQERFLSNFTLNGIVWDLDNSWAVINNEVVKTGDMLNGAKVVSIKPQKVTLSFQDKEFELVLK